MQKILILLLTLALLLCVTSCNGDDLDTSDTSNTSVSTTESSTTESSATETTDMTEINIFSAKVIEVFENALLLYSDDEYRPNEQNDYYVTLPEGKTAEEFAYGDIVKVRYNGSVLDTVPCEVQGVLSLSHAVRKLSDIRFDAVITEVREDSYIIKGTTEGYEREFIVTKPIGELELGDEVRVSYSFRGEYSQTYPTVLDESVAIGNLNPDPVRFFARVTDVTSSSLFVSGDEYYGWVSLRRTNVSSEDFQVGDFVEIPFDGYITATAPSVMYPSAVRHLTEEEIAGYYKEEIFIGRYLGENDEEIVMGDSSSGRYYLIPKANFESIPEFSRGDWIKIVYDGVVDDYRRILFATEIYKHDIEGTGDITIIPI